MKKTEKKKIFVEDNLQCYFFENLGRLNRAIEEPLSEEIIFYSSQVLNSMAISSNFFETLDNGEIREKMLGIKLLESFQCSKIEQKSELKDIGDTSLYLCGVFGENLSKKMVDQNYYIRIGRMAYLKLNTLEPNLLGISDFYSELSNQFEMIVHILTLLARDFFKKAHSFDDLKFS